MCTRIYIDSEREELNRLAELIQNPAFSELLKTGDIRPADVLPILVEEGFHTAAVAGMWGYPNESGQTTYVNARVETVSMQRHFAADLLARRCVIPVCGYYEESLSNKGKESLYFESNGGLLFLAGIWRRDCRGMYRFVLLTTKAGGSTSPLAPRMPLVMNGDFVKTWLCDGKKAEEFLSAQMPHLSYLELSRVSA